MSSTPLAKLSYSVLVASLSTAAVFIVFLATPRLDWYWWLGFVLVAIPVGALLAPVIAYRWTTRPSRRYPVAPRIAEPVDLARERFEFESRRDSYLEARQLRRVI